jgi:predicted lipid-binding transport protein (Tim44 family)
MGEKMLKRSVMPAGAAVLALLLLSGCAGQVPSLNSFNANDPSQRAIGGALVGAGSGALIGGLIGGWEGAGIGAAAGGVIGAVTGAATTPPGASQASVPAAPVYQLQTYSHPVTSSYSSSYSSSPAPCDLNATASFARASACP